MSEPIAAVTVLLAAFNSTIIIVLCIIIPFNVHDALNAVYNNASELLRKLTKFRLYNYCVHADICQV